MRREIKLRAQAMEVPERKLRLRLPGRLASDLEGYRELYARVHGQEIGLSALIEGILDQFLASDRAFQRERRSGTRAVPALPGSHGPRLEEPGD